MGKLISHDAIKLDIDNFPKVGCANLGVLLDRYECSKLREYIDNNRPLSKNYIINGASFYVNNKNFIK